MLTEILEIDMELQIRRGVTNRGETTDGAVNRHPHEYRARPTIVRSKSAR